MPADQIEQTAVRLRPTAPKKINASLRALIAHLGLEETATQLLKYSAPSGFTPEVSMCHFNVWAQMDRLGGSAQPGWLLWQDTAHHFCEAEFHAVWVAPDGRLVDLTPRRDREKRVMFLPDPTRAITLTEGDGRPAIKTYLNVKLHAGCLIEPLRSVVGVLANEAFLRAHGQWDGRWRVDGSEGAGGA
jgi:hypothetical protein